MEYFEDMVVGTVRESSEAYELRAQDIIDFCKQWDPLPFHVDEQVAASTPVGKLFTSAIHTVAIAIRLGHQLQIQETATEIGLGWDEVRFHAPACAGDLLRVRGECIEARPSGSRPDLGVVRSLMTVLNQRDEPVLSFKAAALIRRRPEAS